MAMNKSDSTLKLMQENYFEVISEVSKDMICIICRKFIIDASIGPCGCRYCTECITNYLQGNDKRCPGNSNDCSEYLLNLNCDIHNDFGMNISIAKLTVKCPQMHCNFTAKLRNMENHLRKCNSNTTNVLSDNIGNYLSGLNNCSPVNHVQCEINSQSKFLLESFDNLKNENEILKKDLIHFKDEVELNKNLHLERITALEITVLKIDELNEEMEAVKNDNRRLTEENLKNNQEINRMNEIIERMELVLAQQTTEFNQLKQQCEFLDNLKIDNEVDINTNYFQTNNLELSNYTHDAISENILFEWKIKNFSKNPINKVIGSEPFFTHENGFKICLWVMNNISNLDSGLSFMQGEFDDDLSWPFEHGFTVELVNSYSSKVYMRKTIAYYDYPDNDGWKKPNDQFGDLISFYKHIRLNNTLIKNDCITIRCFVNF